MICILADLAMISLDDPHEPVRVLAGIAFALRWLSGRLEPRNIPISTNNLDLELPAWNGVVVAN